LQFSLIPQEKRGLRGDSAAIAEARAMVETMGGMIIWARLKSVHFYEIRFGKGDIPHSRRLEFYGQKLSIKFKENTIIANKM
jgi:hypothetical protein